jgi:hypothetical protein
MSLISLEKKYFRDLLENFKTTMAFKKSKPDWFFGLFI